MTENTLVNIIKKWETLDHSDLIPHVLFQRAEQTTTMSVEYLEDLLSKDVDDEYRYAHYIWSVELRDFLVLLRDSLLSVIKYEQFKSDEKEVDSSFIRKLIEVIKLASGSLSKSASEGTLSDKYNKQVEHQKSPVEKILEQSNELEIQIKKIYRSYDKVNEIRSHLDTFKKNFYVSYQKQVGAVDDLVSITNILSDRLDTILPSASKIEIESVIALLNESCPEIEELQTLESMDMITYDDSSSFSLATDVEFGQVVMKQLMPQSEVSKWYSSNIYPHIIELESKRKIAVEGSLDALNKTRIVLSGLILEEKDEYNIAASEVKMCINELKSKYTSDLEKERKENTERIEEHINKELFASAIYNEEILFLPHSGGTQISNISRDAQKRMIDSCISYKDRTHSWLRNMLSKYIELDRIPFNSYISNKLLVKVDDERLSLFLKNGYLGKSFTVNRPAITDPIINDYKLWVSGFSGSVLLSGASGSGKSTVLGLLSQEGLNDIIITVRPGEQYFARNKSYHGSFDIGKVIEDVSMQYIGKRIVLAIDNLEQWHTSGTSLFDNISKLFSAIQNFNGDIFFIVCCRESLFNRIKLFKNINKAFSSHVRLNKMTKSDVLEALKLRSKALPELGLLDADQEDNVLSEIVRIADGNVGHAMLEYCRFYSEDYQPNLKSQEFVEMIRDNGALIQYILAFKSIRMAEVQEKLNEIDYRNTSENINYLVGHKILTYTRGDVVTVNPYLIYAVEKALKTKVQ